MPYARSESCGNFFSTKFTIKYNSFNEKLLGKGAAKTTILLKIWAKSKRKEMYFIKHCQIMMFTANRFQLQSQTRVPFYIGFEGWSGGLNKH